MPAQDTSRIKDKIASIIRQRGPCLPDTIAKDAGVNSLFASAFLSELLGEKRIRMTDMKVGSSPVYFIQGQEPLLENFSKFLKSKEKEAFGILKERKILKDSEQEPAIRVALRAIKDFAIPFKNDNDAYWKYFIVSNEEVGKMFESLPKVKAIEEKAKKPEAEEEVKKEAVKEVQTKIIEKTIAKKSFQKKKVVLKKPQKNDRFLEKIREFLSKSSVEIMGIESIGKNEVVLKTRKNNLEILLVAYNKSRIDEKDIVKASKKASEFGMKYSIVSLGKLPKKILDLLESLKNMASIENIE